MGGLKKSGKEVEDMKILIILFIVPKAYFLFSLNDYLKLIRITFDKRHRHIFE